MRLASRVLAGLAVAAFCAAPAVAQMEGGMAGSSGGMAIGVSAGYVSAGGDLSDPFPNGYGMEAGIGGAANFRYGVARNIWVTGGFGYSSHGIKNTSDNVTLLSFVVEPRYTFALSSGKITPFVGGRLQYTRGSASVTGTGDVKASGLGFGALGGAMYSLSPTLSLEGALSFVSQSFGDAEVAGQTQAGSDQSGTLIGLNFGVVFKLGR